MQHDREATAEDIASMATLWTHCRSPEERSCPVFHDATYYRMVSDARRQPMLSLNQSLGFLKNIHIVDA